MERKTSRCPVACSRPDFASWIAGFLLSVVCRTASKVTPPAANTKQVIHIGIASVAIIFARSRDRDFIAGLIFVAGALHRKPAPRCDFRSSRSWFVIRNRALPQNRHKRVPGGQAPRYVNRWHLIELCASALHRMRLAERRAVSPIPQRDCLWPSQALHLPSAHLWSRFRGRARLVEDHKMRCALLRQRSAALLPKLRPLPRAGHGSPASGLLSRTRRICSTLRLSLPHRRS